MSGGLMVALDMDALSNTGAYASHGHSVAGAAGAKSRSLYPRAAMQYHARTVYTNTPAAGAMRGYGSPQMTFAVDCAMDSLSGNTSQATLGTLVEALRHSDRATGLDIDAIRQIKENIEQARAEFEDFLKGFTFHDLKMQFYKQKSCNLTCSIGCARACSEVDWFRTIR